MKKKNIVISSLIFVIIVLSAVIICDVSQKKTLKNIITNQRQNIELSKKLKVENEDYSEKLRYNEDYLNYLKKINPFVIHQAINIDDEHSKKEEIEIFEPFGLKLRLCNKRPQKDANTHLCIAAAFTSPETTIEGLFIVDGKKINSKIDKKRTGACIISDKNKSIDIITYSEITDELLNQVQEKQQSFFQQEILVKNFEIIPCKLFEDRITKWRALIKFDGYFAIGQSRNVISILEFQKSLIDIGAIDAIYLDMGTWSEGWYKDAIKGFVTIGDSKTSTHRQTNWITYGR